MILIGWALRPVLLGQKIEECLKCGVIGPHGLVRRTWWLRIFFVPVMLLWFDHSMVCANCGQRTGIRWLTMLRAIRARRLPLDRERPAFAALPPDDWGRRPAAEEVLDPITVNPKHGLWDLYAKVWPILAVVVIAAIIVFTPRTPSGATIDTNLQHTYGQAHDCWLSTTGAVTGCLMDAGTIEGVKTEAPVICYFDEPLSETVETLSCGK